MSIYISRISLIDQNIICFALGFGEPQLVKERVGIKILIEDHKGVLQLGCSATSHNRLRADEMRKRLIENICDELANNTTGQI